MTLSQGSRAFALAVGLLATFAQAHAQDAKKKIALPSKAETKPESAVDPVHRGQQGNWMARHESIVDRVRKGKTDLLFIGDSITQGWEGAGKEVWKRHYAPRDAANLGIGGDRTQHVLWRLQHGAIDGISPKVAVIMIGTNNIRANTPSEIAEGVKAIVSYLRERLPKTKILLLAVFPRSEKPDAARERIASLNEKIAKLDDGKFIKYLDIGKSFLNADASISKEIMPDFLHLSPKGYRIWADAIEPTLWDMMEGK